MLINTLPELLILKEKDIIRDLSIKLTRTPLNNMISIYYIYLFPNCIETIRMNTADQSNKMEEKNTFFGMTVTSKYHEFQSRFLKRIL